ncbi:MAG: hypothetical protein WBP10_10525, partial [Thermoanaerobaculia bacterium]
MVTIDRSTSQGRWKILKKGVAAALALGLVACGGQPVDEASIDPTAQPLIESPTGRIEPVPQSSVEVLDAFWKPRLETNRRVTIPHILQQNDQTGRVDNFRKAAGLLEGP